jgi:phosphatidylglycerol:prolipoprotein diacylglycerol transferase
VFFGFFCAIVVSCLKLYKIYNAPIDPFYWFCLLGVPIAIAGARMWSFMIGDAKD